MSKEEDIKVLKIQTCILKVNIHCDGCRQKVKKLLQKIDGVYTTVIDAEKGTVTVSGDVDAATLIKKLSKAGKPAELIAPKVPSSNINQLNNQFHKMQLGNGKGGQKDNGKPANGGGGGGNNQKGQPPPQQQLQPPPQQHHHNIMKGFKDLNFPQLKDLKMPFGKNQKTVKFSEPVEEGSDYDDEFDDDDYDDDFDDLDCFEDDFEDDIKNVKMKAMNGGPPFMGAEKKCGGGNIHTVRKVAGRESAPKAAAPTGGQETKNGGAGKKGGCDGPGECRRCRQAGRRRRAEEWADGWGPADEPRRHDGPDGAMNMPRGGQMGNMNMPAPPAAVQGLPAGGPQPGFFPGGGAITPEMFAAANPYQQQYLAAMMQQQRMMMNGQDRTFQPMPYAPRPPPPVSYMPPPPPEYTHFFSDENTNSCSVM
ncbi:unnamed protein product [Spirodela intermedia]|uniref:HMA domain-containing protein n=1 Tax=Spirodela intermedia TaxID=51605 RepID=A0A7I8I902_SPIIN|nr:unnamed protein product [Spirodela intermedia]CAA6654135.1 unnamed protein product [Spirodela intermedia]